MYKLSLAVMLVGCSGPVLVESEPEDCENENEYQLLEVQDIEAGTTNAAELDCGTGTFLRGECAWGDGVTPIGEGLDPSNDTVWICIGRVEGPASPTHRVAARVWCST